MYIEHKKIGDGHPCYIIAEIGSNHDRDLEKAYKLIDMAAEAGVDAVKFQTLKPTDIAKADTPADAYGDAEFAKGKRYWYEVLEEIILPFEWHQQLFEYARSKGLTAFSTPESVEAVNFLERLDVPAYKIASMDIGYTQLLQAIAKTQKPVILSSGIAAKKDLIEAVDTLRANGAGDIAILHCVSDYPPNYDYMSLELISEYKKLFKCPVGFSDHCEDNLLDGIAVFLGANIIEKHITLDKKSCGPDHGFALDEVGLKDLVNTVRIVESAIPVNEQLYVRKQSNLRLYGRSIIVIKDKKAGDKLEYADLDFKRPGTGIKPGEADKVVGLTLTRDVKKNHVLSWEDFK